MGRLLAIDYGKKRIGLSMTDPLQLTAQPFDTWKRSKSMDFIGRLQNLVVEKNIDLIILGHPVHMNGHPSEMSETVQALKEKMGQAMSCPILLWDERWTSKQAHRQLHMMNIKPSQNKEKVDQLASLLLLQNYMDYRESQGENHQEDGA